MGEPTTCLVRSLSTPADTSSCVTQQEMNPMRMLGESISFGRFMSEGLDWERWSAFSHNRYVEEAEKYSKPGSVAAKKAYFEAHYKRKAKEKAAALIQEANARANGTFDSEIQEGNCTNSTVETESIADSTVAANEQPDKDAVNYQVVDDDDDTNQYKCDAGPNDLDFSNVEGEDDVRHTCVDTNLNVENCVILDNSNKEIAIPVEERIPDPGTAGQEVLGLPVKGREVNSSPNLSTKTRAARLPHSLDERKAAAAVPPRSGVKTGSRGKKSDRNSVEKKILTARSLHMSIHLPSGTGATSKTAAAALQSRNGMDSVSKSKKSVGGSMKGLTVRSLYKSINLPSGTSETSKTATAAVKPTNGINRASKSMKTVGDSVEKRPTARSLHMSINLPSGAGETSKTASLFEHNKKVRSNLPSISKHHPLASQTSTEASYGFSNQASANPPSQGRSCLKSSSTTKSNPRSLTIPSPFRFRSEERAVKHKEFLQRMDEIKSKEEEKVQMQRMPKEKTEHDHKKLLQSNGSKPKLHEDRHGGSQSPSNQIRKDKIFGNSWKPPIRTNNAKRVTEKFSRTTRQSVTSLSNITRENASPNVQH